MDSAPNAIIVVHVDAQLGIGKHGDMPWHLPEDLKWFRTTTTNASEGRQNALIMGRATYLSIPPKFRPFQGRINIVLSRTVVAESGIPEGALHRTGEFAGARVVASLEKALSLATELGETTYIVGGGSIYAQAVEHAGVDKIYMTEQERTYQCDTFFPKNFRDYFERGAKLYTSKSADPAFTIYEYLRRK